MSYQDIQVILASEVDGFTEALNDYLVEEVGTWELIDSGRTSGNEHERPAFWAILGMVS